MDQHSLGRRRLLQGAAVAGTVTAASLASPAPAEAGFRPPVRPSREAVLARRRTLRAAGTGVDVHHLLRRTTYGSTPALLAEVQAKGTRAWLAEQLDPASIDDSACDRIVARFPLAHVSPPAMHAHGPYGNWDGMQDLTGLTLARAVWSKRQLFEVMVELWSNHLNITCPSSEVWAGRGWHDAQVVREHALGRFSDLLAASCTSPAMLAYLNNEDSRGSAPNENYGREVLELHSVGRDAGYGQSGVVDAARAFTGLTTWNPWNGGTATTHGTFRYEPTWRYVGPLQVLGWRHDNADPAGGVAVAQSLMRYLAAHPATATRIATRLAVRFVADSPPADLVARLAQVYLDADTAIVPVLQALFDSREFADSSLRKYRRPYEDVVAGMRTLGLTASTDQQTGAIGSVVWALGQLGHAPLGWHPPDGYPDVAAAWTGVGSVLGRWNLHLGLTQGWWKEGVDYPGTDLYARLLPGAQPATRADLVSGLHARLMPGIPLPAAHRDALVAFLGAAGPLRDGDTSWLFPVLVALVMDSPLWSAR